MGIKGYLVKCRQIDRSKDEEKGSSGHVRGYMYSTIADPIGRPSGSGSDRDHKVATSGVGPVGKDHRVCRPRERRAQPRTPLLANGRVAEPNFPCNSGPKNLMAKRTSITAKKEDWLGMGGGGWLTRWRGGNDWRRGPVTRRFPPLCQRFNPTDSSLFPSTRHVGRVYPEGQGFRGQRYPILGWWRAQWPARCLARAMQAGPIQQLRAWGERCSPRCSREWGDLGREGIPISARSGLCSRQENKGYKTGRYRTG